MSQNLDLPVAQKANSDIVSELKVTRHSTYYFDPVVEGVLFKIPKIGFMVPGTMFSDMFTLPAGDDEQPEGETDANPIDIPLSITEKEFFGFLLVMYPFFGGAHKEIHYDELVGALKLATMWEFRQIREKVISALLPMLESRNIVETILLAKQYQIRTLLRESYLKLVNQDIVIQDLRQPLQLDWETISGIFATQVYAGNIARCKGCGSCRDSSTTSMEAYLDKVFQSEFEQMEVE